LFSLVQIKREIEPDDEHQPHAEHQADDHAGPVVVGPEGA
jgi:hypothetical protein